MKIGILTFHWANHFGAVIQTWALVELLKSRGVDVEVIDFRPPHLVIANQVNINISKSFIKYRHVFNRSIIFSAIGSLGEAANYIWFKEYIRSILYDDFRYRYIPMSSKCIKTLDELRYECDNYDICLVGSDQVWNPEFLRLSNYAYILPFRLRNAVKAAFSASIAVELSKYPRFLRILKHALSDFKFISLRESIHAELLSRLTGRNIYHTLDPTLLIDKQYLEVLARERDRVTRALGSKYAVIYNLSLDILPLAKIIVEELGLDTVIYMKPPLHKKLKYNKYIRGAHVFYSSHPIDILALIKNASLVVTDSYHGVIASIQFEKNFIVPFSESLKPVGVRIKDLLGKLGLEDRIIDVEGKNTVEKVNEIINHNINYKHVSKKLSDLKNRSMKLLDLMLEHSG